MGRIELVKRHVTLNRVLWMLSFEPLDELSHSRQEPGKVAVDLPAPRSAIQG